MQVMPRQHKVVSWPRHMGLSVQATCSLVVWLSLCLLPQWARTAAAIQATAADLLLSSPAGQWPPYERGAGKYKYVLSPRGLRNGISYLGSNERLRVALDRWKKGGNLTIAFLGGSITIGMGQMDAMPYPKYIEQYMRDHYGPTVHFANGGIGGTPSSFMSLCHNVRVPEAADIVVLEFSVNDPPPHSTVTQPPFANNPRRSFERLVRKLLKYPRRPAVIVVHSYSWLVEHLDVGMGKGMYWKGPEYELDVFTHYYQLPTLSVRTAVYRLMQEGVPGFWVNTTRREDPTGAARKAFYADFIHPDGLTGCRVMGELVIHLIESTLKGMESQPVDEGDKAAVDLPLPAPMVPNNYESLHDVCFMGHIFTSIVTKAQGFQWMSDSPDPQKPKYGMVATEAGSILELTIDTHASAHANDAEADKAVVTIELAYLKSYEHMGTANVSCVGGCTCASVVFNGHQTTHNSQLQTQRLYVSQHPECVINITVRNETDSGGHKVKVAAVIISEESGSKSPLSTNGQVMKSHDG